MSDGLELRACVRIGKHPARHFTAAQPAIGVNDLRSEGMLDFLEGRLAGFDHQPGEDIGIHHRDTALAQQAFGGGFAHAHTTGQTDHFHRVE